MTTYRVGRHQPQNVYRDDQYIGVMFTAEDAQLVVEALNGGRSSADPRCPDEWQSPHRARSRPNMCATCGLGDADSCTCTKVGPDADCIVHQGRRARGPKPPPLGPGCVCDGSGQTCPRHGVVI